MRNSVNTVIFIVTLTVLLLDCLIIMYNLTLNVSNSEHGMDQMKN